MAHISNRMSKDFESQQSKDNIDMMMRSSEIRTSQASNKVGSQYTRIRTKSDARQ